MKLRRISSILIILVFVLGIKAQENQPNILFIISDDLNTSLSGFGHPQCKTPNLDKLADRGVSFYNMHCQYPVCGASRASIMSGLYPYKNGTMGNIGTLRSSMPEVVTMSQMFRNNGYYSARVSKIYHMRIPADIVSGDTEHDDPLSWDEAINIKALEQNSPGELTNWSPKSTGSQAFRGVIGTGETSDYADGMAADRAIELLGKLKDGPFFLAVGFVRPHVPLVAPEKFYKLYERDEMIAPVVPENDLEDVPEIIRSYKSNSSTYGVTPELHKGLLEAYYSSISFMDAQVGRILNALDKYGLTDNTIIVFTSDHGYLLGHHHKFQKQHLFEESTRVPFIISVPWIDHEHGNKTIKITELIDLFPTLAELARLEAPGNLQGNSMVPLLQNISSPQWTKNEAFTISRKGGESLRTEKWRFNQWNWGESGFELYDLKNDPGEFINLAYDPEYVEIVEEMQKRLIRKRIDAGYRRDFYNRETLKQ